MPIQEPQWWDRINPVKYKTNKYFYVKAAGLVEERLQDCHLANERQQLECVCVCVF